MRELSDRVLNLTEQLGQLEDEAGELLRRIDEVRTELDEVTQELERLRVLYEEIDKDTKTEDDTDDNEDEIKAPKYPGDDPTIPPGEDWEWRGRGDPGSSKGSWYNPKTGESLYLDLNHSEPIGPHWDYQPYRNGLEYRLFLDGTLELK